MCTEMSRSNNLYTGIDKAMILRQRLRGFIHITRLLQNPLNTMVRKANCVSHECRLQDLLERHIFGITPTAINSGRG